MYVTIKLQFNKELLPNPMREHLYPFNASSGIHVKYMSLISRDSYIYTILGATLVITKSQLKEETSREKSRESTGREREREFNRGHEERNEGRLHSRDIEEYNTQFSPDH